MNLTRSNIAYDLTISPHKLNIGYGVDVINSVTFVFSSALYRSKFIERYEEHRKLISSAMSKRYGFSINNNLIADIKLYKTIEKRGFLLITGKGELLSCQEDIILNGESLMKQSSAE